MINKFKPTIRPEETKIIYDNLGDSKEAVIIAVEHPAYWRISTWMTFEVDIRDSWFVARHLPEFETQEVVGIVSESDGIKMVINSPSKWVIKKDIFSVNGEASYSWNIVDQTTYSTEQRIFHILEIQSLDRNAIDIPSVTHMKSVLSELAPAVLEDSEEYFDRWDSWFSNLDDFLGTEIYAFYRHTDIVWNDKDYFINPQWNIVWYDKSFSLDDEVPDNLEFVWYGYPIQGPDLMNTVLSDLGYPS